MGDKGRIVMRGNGSITRLVLSQGRNRPHCFRRQMGGGAGHHSVAYVVYRERDRPPIQAELM